MYFVTKFVITAIVVAIGAVLYPMLKSPKSPELKDQWFGRNKLKPGQPLPKDPVVINKFTVNVADVVLEDLRRRLESARFAEPIAGTQFKYGFNSDYLRKVVEYWKTEFDWRKQEKQLNQFSQFKTQINGLNIHFLHIKPLKATKTVIPLMLIHEWPGSVWDFHKLIPLLIEPTNDMAFEIICPSIPGIGFSDAAQQKVLGFDMVSTARIFVKLMDRLNHKKFVVHGSHWGTIVSMTMAKLYPHNIRGIHTLMHPPLKLSGIALLKIIVGAYIPFLVFENPDKDYNKLYPVWDKLAYLLREFGITLIQATKPDTVGAALIDSPVGLAAYILERFSISTGPDNLMKSDGGLTGKFTLDELLTNVMIYWVSNNVASSMRLYKESLPLMLSPLDNLDDIPVPASVAAAVADFPKSSIRIPKMLLEYQYMNLIQYTDMPRGGIFAALEEPKLVADDIKKFVKLLLEKEKSNKLTIN